MITILKRKFIYLFIHTYSLLVLWQEWAYMEKKIKPEICANQRVWDKLVKARYERVKEL